MNKNTLFNLCKYLLAFGLLGYVIYSNWSPESGNGLEDVWQRHVLEGKPIHGGFFALAFAIFSSSLLLTLLRWYVLVRAQDLPFRVRDALRLGLLGFFYNTFLPGSVGGDIVKAAYVAREQSRRTVAVATVLMDRAIALWALIWFVALIGGGFWASGNLAGDNSAPARSIVLAAVGIVTVTTVGWLLLGLLPSQQANRLADWLTRLPKVGGSAAELWRAVWMYRCRQKAVLLAMLITGVGQFGFVCAFYCCTRTLWDGNMAKNPLPTLAQHFMLVPVGMVVQAVPLFPGGVGIGELGFAKLYGLFGSDPANGVTASLVMRVITWMLGLIGCLVSANMRSQLSRGSPSAAKVPPPSINGTQQKAAPIPHPVPAIEG